MDGRTAGVILAAGASTRFGSDKLRARLDGKPVLQHVIEAATGSRLDPVHLVVGHDAAALLDAVVLGRALPVTNLEWATGQSSSLRAGLRAAGDVDAIVVLLGDQPRVTAALIDALVEARGRWRSAAVVSTTNGHRSPPALISHELFAAVERLEGDVGARSVIAGCGDVVEIEVTAALGRLGDIDLPSELASQRS